MKFALTKISGDSIGDVYSVTFKLNETRYSVHFDSVGDRWRRRMDITDPNVNPMFVFKVICSGPYNGNFLFMFDGEVVVDDGIANPLKWGLQQCCKVLLEYEDVVDASLSHKSK